MSNAAAANSMPSGATQNQASVQNSSQEVQGQIDGFRRATRDLLRAASNAGHLSYQALQDLMRAIWRVIEAIVRAVMRLFRVESKDSLQDGPRASAADLKETPDRPSEVAVSSPPELPSQVRAIQAAVADVSPADAQTLAAVLKSAGIEDFSASIVAQASSMDRLGEMRDPAALVQVAMSTALRALEALEVVAGVQRQERDDVAKPLASLVGLNDVHDLLASVDPASEDPAMRMLLGAQATLDNTQSQMRVVGTALEDILANAARLEVPEAVFLGYGEVLAKHLGADWQARVRQRGEQLREQNAAEAGDLPAPVPSPAPARVSRAADRLKALASSDEDAEDWAAEMPTQ